jgi:O-acetyl-ADP-ribose deacetylase (regulator of RNase III)
MIIWKTGDIFTTKCSTIVNTVNIEGVMGKGIALECKKRYPLMFKCYTYACKYLHGQEQNIKTTILNQGGDIYFWYNPKSNEDKGLWGDLILGVNELHNGILLDSIDNKCILNFATKEFWRNPSKLEWIERGLYNFAEKDYKYKGEHFKFWNMGPNTWTLQMSSIAWPKLGCSNGGLKWEDVKPLMIKYLDPLPIKCEIYE